MTGIGSLAIRTKMRGVDALQGVVAAAFAQLADVGAGGEDAVRCRR